MKTEILDTQEVMEFKSFTVNCICAWCGRKIGVSSGFTDKHDTHGMCPDCYSILTGEPFIEGE